MRIVSATLESIHFFAYDAATEEALAKKYEDRIAKRKATLARIGIQVDPKDWKSQIKISVTERQLTDLLLAGENAEVSSIMDIADDRLTRVADIIASAAEKLERFAGTVPEVNQEFNQRVEVYTPGAGLMLFNRIMLLQNECSDALQAELDNGWRIVAACPQPDQRRPDYILGRYDPQYALESGRGNHALRS